MSSFVEHVVQEENPDRPIIMRTCTKDPDSEPLYSWIYTERSGIKVILDTDVDAGTRLTNHVPEFIVTTLSQLNHALLPADCDIVRHIPSDIPSTLPPIMTWLMTWNLIKTRSIAQLQNMCATKLPQLGPDAYIIQCIADSSQLDAEDRQWLEFILRQVGDKWLLVDILRLFGQISVSTLELRTPISDVPYGLALYTELALIKHSCNPSCVLVTSLGGVGRLYVGTQPLAKGSEITLNRDFMPRRLTTIRCLALAPSWIAEHARRTRGTLCSCPECTDVSALMHTFFIRAIERDPEKSSETVVNETAASLIANLDELWGSNESHPHPGRSTVEWGLRSLFDNPIFVRLLTSDNLTQPPGSFIHLRYRFETGLALIQACSIMPSYCCENIPGDAARIEEWLTYMSTETILIYIRKSHEFSGTPATTVKRIIASHQIRILLAYCGILLQCYTGAERDRYILGFHAHLIDFAQSKRFASSLLSTELAFSRLWGAPPPLPRDLGNKKERGKKEKGKK